ncbi:alpha/beta hydrolase [Clostridium gasigenes]|uniref:Alpha/beta hydrolase n=1 Tax=Clostridium gasigenes TaxID=94869 RepID=A0A7X0SBS4_9CLOT|nr:alpha/beta hydrolase [Clostridium gasigenes]MBB6714755.1 alpha/beta hydrolase [Clostridium gasigenes]
MKGLLIISVFIVIIILLSINFIGEIKKDAFKHIILDDRKDKGKMIKVLKERFFCDYKNYEDLEYEELEILSSDGFKLKGYYYNKYPDSNKVMIIHHGYTANHYVCIQFLDIFFEEGFNVLLVDMRSHGESEGEYITYGYKEQKDLDIWVNLIRNKIGEDGMIGLHGQSMGGATVLMYGGNYSEKIDFVIADCAYSNGKEILRYQFKQADVPFFPIYNMVNRQCKSKCGFDMNNISPIDCIKDNDIPVLFVHGTGDNVVPVTMSEEMFSVKIGNKNKLVIIPDAVHVGAYAKDKDTYVKAIREFISELGI